METIILLAWTIFRGMLPSIGIIMTIVAQAEIILYRKGHGFHRMFTLQLDLINVRSKRQLMEWVNTVTSFQRERLLTYANVIWEQKGVLLVLFLATFVYYYMAIKHLVEQQPLLRVQLLGEIYNLFKWLPLVQQPCASLQ